MYSLGIDIGSSSVKVSLLDLKSGKCAASSTNPSTEAPIRAERPGWAEQSPDSWWNYLAAGLEDIGGRFDLSKVECIGVSYQMHGLVALDAANKPVRDAIIWCDSRAVETGESALKAIGLDKCMSHTLNSPGNFTASKLAWVKAHEPELYGRIGKFMLPGDYIIYLLTGTVSTTEPGLSEQILWDFRERGVADFVLEHYGIDRKLLPPIVPAIGVQAVTDARTERLFGIRQGTPVSYRAGDQMNNAFSLNVLNPGEIAATGGTSGVVFGVTDRPKGDERFRVNTFLHVNNREGQDRLGTLLCINGTGIMNAWVRRCVTPDLSYAAMDELAAGVAPGSDGLLALPFGNGAERVLENRIVGASFAGLDLVRHTRAHIVRAAQEGIAFSFRYGIDVMRSLGHETGVIRAGRANMFLNSVFTRTLATLCDATIELYDTDGALGAARGAALGAGLYGSAEEAFKTLSMVGRISPVPEWKPSLEQAYGKWKTELENKL